jgi:hypothetical protein
VHSSVTRWSPSWCSCVNATLPWDPGLSLFINLRLQLHPSVAGVLLLRWLDRPTFNRYFVRSIHPGVCVLYASVTPTGGFTVTNTMDSVVCFSFRSRTLL